MAPKCRTAPKYCQAVTDLTDVVEPVGEVIGMGPAPDRTGAGQPATRGAEPLLSHVLGMEGSPRPPA